MGDRSQSNSDLPTVTLEGTYSPADYLQDVVLNRPGYTATLKEGRIEVVFQDPEPLPDPDLQAAVTREVSTVFQTHMILTGQPWQMTGLTLNRHYPDGTRDIWVNAASSFTVGSPGGLNIIIQDAEGNIIKDTKSEHLAYEQGFRDQVLQHAHDQVLQGLIASFTRAVNDPADRMIHLYEIRDALQTHFRGKKKSKKELGLTEKEWSDLGYIADKEPIEESRHRGQHLSRRPATDDEQSRAFACARRMIKLYIEHLDHVPAS